MGKRELEALQNEQRTTDELRRLQLEKLRRTLSFAVSGSEYYARTLTGGDRRARQLDSAEDLQCMPYLNKEDLQRQLDQLRTNDAQGREFRAGTSGSTGVASVFYLDSEQLAWVTASVLRGRSWWGVRRGEREMVLWGRPLQGSSRLDAGVVTWLKYRLRNCLFFNTFRELDSAELRRLAAAVRSWRPTVVYGYGSSIARLASWMYDNSMDLSASEAPRIVEYTADTISPKELELIRAVFGAPVLSAYGASECGGVAQQCRAGRLHISVDHAVVEIVDSAGRLARQGDVGEIVLTTLNNRAMPLVRYRIGDLGSVSDESCECESGLPTMTLQAGKAVDLISTSTKSNISAHVLDYINLYVIREGLRGIRQFLVRQIELDKFELIVVRDDVFDPRATESFVKLMRQKLGSGIAVRVQYVESIPLQTTGKRRYFERAM